MNLQSIWTLFVTASVMLLGANLAGAGEHSATDSAVETSTTIGGAGQTCLTDPDCINRFHPDIPMNRMAQPGQVLTFKTAMPQTYWGPLTSKMMLPSLWTPSALKHSKATSA